jgi:hypothetical protein
MSPNEIKKQLARLNPEAWILDGYDNALVGISEDNPPRAMYSPEKIMQIDIVRHGWTQEEAEEWFGFNVLGLEPNPNGPRFSS